jgi:hypothetical protein
MVRTGGFRVAELDPSSKTVRSFRLPDRVGSAVYCVAGKALILAHHDGAVEALPLDGSAGRRFQNVNVGSDNLEMHQLDDDHVLIVDRSGARVGLLDVQSGRASFNRIAAKEIAESAAFFAERVRQHTATGSRTATPLIIAASCLSPENDLLCLVGPVDRAKGALILRLRHNGDVGERMRVQLPTKDERPTLPAKMLAANGDLYLVYPSGDVDVYRIK